MDRLTPFPKGSIRELFAFSYPIFLALLTQCAMSFCDRCFLSHYSLEAFKGASVGGYLALLFQASCIRLTSINQTYISRAMGEKRLERIAPYTWQMIWISLLLALVITPIGLLIRYYYFAQNPIEMLGSAYFLILLLGNSLFVLGATFSGFQAGIGETKTLIQVGLITNLCNALLNYLLIFGIEGWIPPLGVVGAALGTVLAQGLQCAILFFSFFTHKKREAFQVRKYHFSPPLTLQLLRLGIPNAIRRILSLAYWVIVVKMISHLGGDFLLALSYGSALYFPLSALVIALGQGTLSLFAFFLGEKSFSLVWKTFRSATSFLFIIFLALGILIAFFSSPLIKFIIPKELSPTSFRILQWSSVWFWVYFFVLNFLAIVESLLVALKKTPFMMKFSLLTDLFSIVLPYYLAFYVFDCSADKVWMANWVCCIFPAIVMLYKIRTSLEKEKTTLPNVQESFYAPGASEEISRIK